jgi:hypothetical protein
MWPVNTMFGGAAGGAGAVADVGVGVGAVG